MLYKLKSIQKRIKKKLKVEEWMNKYFLCFYRYPASEVAITAEPVVKINSTYLQIFINNVTEFCCEHLKMESLEAGKGHQQIQKFSAMLTQLILR